MVQPLRHRQTKGAATAMFYLMPPRHISTLPNSEVGVRNREVRFSPKIRPRSPGLPSPLSANNGSRALTSCQKKSRPNAALNSNLMMADHAAINAGSAFRR